MEREFKWLPLVISLLSGLAVSVMMIVRRNFSLVSLIITLAVMLGFYIIGLIFRSVLVFFKTKEEPEPETAEGDEEGLEDVASESEDETESVREMQEEQDEF